MRRIPGSKCSLFTRHALLACVALACCPTAFALDPALDVSQYAHTSWKIRDGFTKGAIFAIAQTPDGYLWLGTESGLVRFDGVRAVPWQPPAGQRVPSNFINALLVARDGTLWIGTHEGLASWKDGKFSIYRELRDLDIAALIEDHEGTVWVGASGVSDGDLCAARNGTFECYGAASFGRGVFALYEDHKGSLWVASGNGLWRWKPGTPERYTYPPGVTAANSLVEDDSGTLLLSTINGLKRLAAGRIDRYELPGIDRDFWLTRLLRSSDGSLWLASLQGLSHFHQGRTDVFKAVDGLSADSVVPIFEDREGNVWVGTPDGLDRFRNLAVPTISRKQGLSNSAAFSVLATRDGSIWIVTADGLNRWENGQVIFYRTQKALGQSGQKLEPELTGDLAATEIANTGLMGDPQSLGQDNRGRLWASTSVGVFYFEGGRFIRVPGVPGGFTFSVVGDDQGNIWISNRTALIHVTPEPVIERIPWSQFRHQWAQALLPDRAQGGLWIGFRDGGVAYFKDGEVHASYGPADGLGHGTVSQLLFGSRGTLWAATEGGLSRIKDGHIATLTSKNGLPCDAVHWVMQDEDDAYWLYKPCGLVRVARSELDGWVNDPTRIVQFTTFGAADGVRTYEIPSGYPPMVTKSPDGRIWFLARDGVSVLDPRHLTSNKLPPPVHIEQITADRISHDVTTDTNEQLSLPALSRELEIDYTALSLVAPEKIQFRYKLEGFDRDWQDVGNRRQAFYTNLPPRNYRFRVMACNNSGVWNETGTYFDFTIAPAYYQTTWFRVLLAIAFLMLIGAIYQLRLRQVAGQVRARMEERLEERERIARDLHDTLLQSVQGLILKFHAIAKQIPRDEPAHDALEKTLDDADEVLAEGRDRLRNLRATSIPFGGLPAAFERVAEETPQGADATFKTVVEGKVRELHPMVREECYWIGREAVVNALTHSNGSKVEVEITYDPRQFRLRVRDDGRGIDPGILEGGRSDHWGLQGMRERAQKIGGQLNLWSRPETGTEVELIIPRASAYQRAHDKSKKFWLRSSSGNNDSAPKA
jgi:signal transduction histidine kinase/ligand-binding sensor domain-containing protein